MEKFKEVLAGIAFFGVLIFLCSDLGMAIWSTIFYLAIFLAVLICVGLNWIGLFKRLSDLGRFILIIATYAFIWYVYNHRDVATIILGALLLGGFVYVCSKTETYHGESDDFNQGE